MNATPPEAKTEYSRASPAFGRASAPSSTPVPESDPGATTSPAHGRRQPDGSTSSVPGLIRGAILFGGLLGALLLVVAEFTTLFTIRTSAGAPPIPTVGTGSHHTYALVPIAALVIVLSIAVYTAVSRPALLAIGVLSVIALLIALLGDLPDAQATGLIGGGAQHYVAASASPSAGLYMETLGGVVLLITSVCGFLLLGPPPRRPSHARRDPKPVERARRAVRAPEPVGPLVHEREPDPVARREPELVHEREPELADRPNPDRFWFEQD